MLNWQKNYDFISINQMDKSILFICEMPPVNTGASSVLFFRHLKLLEQDGFKISVVVNEIGLKNSKSEIPKSWNTFVLPNRKWWYPPYKPDGLLKQIRYYLIYFELINFLKINKPDIIIGCLYGIYLSGFCSLLSKLLNIKLFMFYHDRAELLNYQDNLKMQKITQKHNFEIINQANKIWTVSEQLVYYKQGWENKFQVIYPIPEELHFVPPIWNENFANSPVIGYAGSLYNEVVDIIIIIAKILKQLNGKLLILTHQSENVEKIKHECDNVINFPTMPTYNACKFIYDNCSSFLVAYPSDIKSMPWIESCFPSKFTQFMQTGLPNIVISTEESAIAKWCIKYKWIGYNSNYKKENIASFLNDLCIKNKWEAMRDQSIEFMNQYFDPEYIHSKIKF